MGFHLFGIVSFSQKIIYRFGIFLSRIGIFGYLGLKLGYSGLIFALNSLFLVCFTTGDTCFLILKSLNAFFQ